MKSESIKNLAIALHQFQAKLEPPIKDKAGIHGSNYADLGTCWESVRGILHEFGLSVTHLGALAPQSNAPVLVTRLMHVSGEWIDSVMLLNTKDSGPIAMASAITYGRRYGLCAILGITPIDEDDDGAAASNNGSEKASLFVGKRKSGNM